MLTEFMQEMDGLSSATKNKDQMLSIVGATNRPQDLDEAVLRRLPRRLMIDLPAEKEREGSAQLYISLRVVGRSRLTLLTPLCLSHPPSPAQDRDARRRRRSR
jgi:MoxR-like ATPase